MKARKATLLPGDYSGRELAQPVVELLAAAGAEIEWEIIQDVTDEEHQIRPEVLDSIRRNGVALTAPFATPPGVGNLGAAVELRKALDLYAGVRRVRSRKGIKSRYENVDLVVIRENTEDVYIGLEHEVHPGVVESIKVVTREASERIFRFAYRYARAHGRRKLAIVHKANIMKQSDGLFLRVGQAVAADYPDIETRAIIVDNTCMQLVSWPWQFDVLVCGNLYGDIISDLGAGLVGGISAVWGVDQGEDVMVFEAIHGRAPDLTGKDLANPLPLIRPAIALLSQVGQHRVAESLDAAVEKVLLKGKHLTRDLGGRSRTSTMIKAIRDAL